MGLWLAVSGAAVRLSQPASAARQPAGSAAAVGAGLWLAAAAAGRSSASAAVDHFLGTPQETVVAGLLGVLPETDQEK